jgi:membrane-associated phospholipid phosphatase
MEKFAKALSRIFDGSLISIPIFIIICLAIIKNPLSALGWAFLCILFGTLIPYLYIFFLFRKNIIDDMHVPNKENRIKPLIVTIVCYILGYFVLYILEAHIFLRSIFVASIIITVILTAITYFWKISFHTSWVTFVTITYYVLFGKWMLTLLLLTILVGWARVKIKRHTILQVTLGAAISAIVTLFVYSRYEFIDLF